MYDVSLQKTLMKIGLRLRTIIRDNFDWSSISKNDMVFKLPKSFYRCG